MFVFVEAYCRRTGLHLVCDETAFLGELDVAANWLDWQVKNLPHGFSAGFPLAERDGYSGRDSMLGHLLVREGFGDGGSQLEASSVGNFS